MIAMIHLTINKKNKLTQHPHDHQQSRQTQNVEFLAQYRFSGIFIEKLHTLDLIIEFLPNRSQASQAITLHGLCDGLSIMFGIALE